MAYASSQQWEGLVLKGSQDPYMNVGGPITELVKLKDYIPGLGDSVDLVVIGGRSDTVVVPSLKLLPGSWTTFFLACREISLGSHGGGGVHYRIVGQVSPPVISMSNLHLLKMHGRLSQTPFSFTDPELSIATELRGHSSPSHLFHHSAVVEVVGAGFDRPPNAQYLTLRFPRVVKVHNDRIADEVVSFAEYQRLAESSLENGSEQAQYAFWLGRLDVDSVDDSGQTATASQTSLLSELNSAESNHDSKPLTERVGAKRRAASPLADPFRHRNEFSIRAHDLDRDLTVIVRTIPDLQLHYLTHESCVQRLVPVCQTLRKAVLDGFHHPNRA